MGWPFDNLPETGDTRGEDQVQAITSRLSTWLLALFAGMILVVAIAG